MTSPYRPVYDAAIKELADLTSESETLESRLETARERIAEVKKGALALAPLVSEQPWIKYPHLFPEMSLFSGFGLTPQIRAALAKPPADWMTPVAIRDAVKAAGYKGKTENLLPSVHTILKRLIEMEEIESDTREGRTWYRWKASYDPSDAEAARKHAMTRVVRGIAKRGLRNVRIGGK